MFLLWYNHLGDGHAIKDWSNGALVVVCDVVEYNTLSVVEANVEFPVLPLDLATCSCHVERDALGLRNVYWLQIRPIASILLDI